MAHAALYLRVSSLGQEENYSLPGQEEDGCRWCAQKSYTFDLDGLNEAMNQAENGTEDLLADLTSILYSFCTRLHRQRRAKRKMEALIATLDAKEGTGATS